MQPDDLDERIRAGDKAAISLPLLKSVTTNEIHAVQLGFGAGLVLGKAGQPLPAAGLAGYAILKPARQTRGIGSMTIIHEPWWFCSGLVAGYVVGRRSR